jgi:hypothetical protein
MISFSIISDHYGFRSVTLITVRFRDMIVKLIPDPRDIRIVISVVPLQQLCSYCITITVYSCLLDSELLLRFFLYIVVMSCCAIGVRLRNRTETNGMERY